jgi:hypothetical protein
MKHLLVLAAVIVMGSSYRIGKLSSRRCNVANRLPLQSSFNDDEKISMSTFGQRLRKAAATASLCFGLFADNAHAVGDKVFNEVWK